MLIERGGGWWELPDGSKVRGRARADRALAELLAAQPGQLRVALEITIDQMQLDQEPSKAALVQAARTLADTLDGTKKNAQLWRQYRDFLTDLTREEGGDDVEELLKEIRSAAPVRNPSS